MTNNKFDSYILLNITDSDSEITLPAAESVKQIPNTQRKKRLKKKERDLLKSSNSNLYKPQELYCLRSPCGNEDYLVEFNSSWGDVVRSALLLICIISLPLLVWFTLHLQHKLTEVEASGSELPAKFHESHVRLQMVEKNHSAIWTSLNDMSTDMNQVKLKLSAMETSLSTLQASLMGNPSLTSLPNNVAELQKSVATFGAGLQDVHTSFKASTEDREKVAKYLTSNDESIAAIKKELKTLHAASFLPATISREGISTEQPVAVAVHQINDEMSSLSSSMFSLNSSISSKFDAVNADRNKAFEDTLLSLNGRFEKVEKSLSTLPIQNLTSVPSEVKDIKDKLDQVGNNLVSLSNSIDVVKGVEKKLEGSQVQMASGVSALKQQIQKIEEKVAGLMKPAPSSSFARRRRSADEKFQDIYYSTLT